MRRCNSAIQGRAETSFDYPATRRLLTSNVLDSKALRSSRRHDYGPRRCSLKVLLALVMGALVVVILWIKHGSQMKSKRQSFILPVYASAFNDSWRDGVPSNSPSSISRSSHLRSLMEKSEHPNYISEVRPALKHIVYQIKLEVKGKVFFTALDSGSFATWLFCNYHPSHEMNEIFYTPTSENFIAPQRFKEELEEAYVDGRAYLTFRECGPELLSEAKEEGKDADSKKLAHMCFKINYDKWGHVTAVLVEDNVLISASNAAPINIKFGCGFSFDDSMATASYGILGLGNMTISIPKQLADKGLIDHVVGFCFSYGIYQVDYDQRHGNFDPIGYMVLGQPSDYDVGYQWIPMGEKPLGCGFDIINFVHIQMNKFKYNIKKHDEPLIGATIIDIGATYMNLVPILFHGVFDLIEACAHQHGYTHTHLYGEFTYYWKSPPLDSYFSIYKHFHELKIFFYTEKNEKYIFRISPFGYLHIIDKMDVPSQNRILHQYVIALAIIEEITDGDEIPLNVIGGLALRGNKFIIDNVKQRIGLRPEYKCAMPEPEIKK